MASLVALGAGIAALTGIGAACAMPMLKLPPWPAICVKSCWRAT